MNKLLEEEGFTWKFLAHQIHPAPDVTRMDSYRFVFMAVRDPVDRFRSAFDWRLFKLFQHPNSPANIHDDDCGRAIRAQNTSSPLPAACIHQSQEKTILRYYYQGASARPQ